jgi:hypothetical protein
LFLTRRLRALVIGKFIFEVNAAVAALAGSTRIGIGQFLVYDIVSAMVWVGAWCGLGYLLKDGVKQVAAGLGWVGPRLLLLVVLAVGGYLALKYAQRRRFLSLLRGARITPEELQARLAAGQGPMVVDLRAPLDLEMTPYAIPGALRISTEELEGRATAVSPDTDIVLYCT